MKKAQISIFVIIGIVFLILVGTYILNKQENKSDLFIIENQKIVTLSDARSVLSNYVFYCIRESAEKVFQDTGLREDTIGAFENAVSSNVKTCTEVMLAKLKKEKYSINEGEIDIIAAINPETVSIDLTYPLSLEYEGQRTELDKFSYVFDRSTTRRIENGITTEDVLLISSNRKAQITIPKGVSVTDNLGNPVTELGIRVEDLHFDGLENKYVVGQLVYDAFPDGLTFSEPVDLTIEFRDEDIPEGYTTDNLMISYWDENDGIWYALDTEISGNKATAKITHFTDYTINTVFFNLFSTHIFEQRFSPYGVSLAEEGSRNWAISVSENPKEGVVSIQSTYKTLDEFKHINLENGVCLEKDTDKCFKDFRKIWDDAEPEFIVQPKIEYGYYSDPEAPSEATFTNCEEEDTDDFGTKYGLYKGSGDSQLEIDDPYFELKGCPTQFTCSGLPCPDNNKIECVKDKQYCSVNKNNKMCVPYYDDKRPVPLSSQINNMSCCLVDPETYFSNDNTVKEFGWHNYQCAGGTVRPAEGEPASDFIVFAPNGNAVILLAAVLPKPFKPIGGVIDFSDFKKFYNYYKAYSFNSKDLPTSEELIGDISQNDPFYCQITPFSNKINIPLLATKLFVSNTIKTKLGIPITKKITGFGIYGLDIIKLTNHDLAKTEIHAECELMWFVVGNGYIINTPDNEIFQKHGVKEVVGTNS